LQYPLILGDDFLLDNKCNIHYPSRTLFLHESAWQVALITTKGGKAKTAKRCTIPRNTISLKFLFFFQKLSLMRQFY